MALTITRIDRVLRQWDVAVTDADGEPVTVTGVDLALLNPREQPDGDTVWTATTYADGVAAVVLAGPDADDTDALVVAQSSDLWSRITDDPEVTATRVERITVR